MAFRTFDDSKIFSLLYSAPSGFYIAVHITALLQSRDMLVLLVANLKIQKDRELIAKDTPAVERMKNKLLFKSIISLFLNS